MKIRVRIAPSPTGMAHIGTAYMGLFNWAFAKKHGGSLILRLEDTDQKRHVPKAEKIIYDTFDWLGIPASESPIHPGKYRPYRQSQRLEIYQQYADQLIKNGQVYSKKNALWLKMPKSGSLGWEDKVRGQITFEAKNLKDWVIVKSDGFPTYNFANVIDDFSMKISHVIRGEEHISNTPLQLALYSALNITPPIFAHLPVLRNQNHQKLSKRRDQVSLDWFKKQGYLPKAILNFLALQGWSHPQEKSIFSLNDFVNQLTLKRIRTSSPIFDFRKLNWINGEYIRQTSDNKLIKLAKQFSRAKLPDSWWPKVIPLIKERVKVLSNIDDWVEFFTKSPKIDSAPFTSQAGQQLSNTLSDLTNCNWQTKSIQTTLLKLVDRRPKWKRSSFFMNLRLAITGKKISPPLLESMEILGRKECLKRIKFAIRYL